jgi:hypothetical protein
LKKKQNELNELKKSQKIPKYNELIIQNKLLNDQCNKLNYLYLNTQEKLMQYEGGIKELVRLKENVSKQDFMILNFQENYTKAQKEIYSKNKEIQKLIKNIHEKQEIIDVIKKKLENQYQLNERLLKETENIKEENTTEPIKEVIPEEKEKDEVIESLEEILLSDLKEKNEDSSQEPVVNIKEDINPIEAYELDEEANAVISTQELENIEKERNELYGVENNAKLIEEYETDQENKAIISYSELLKNANSLELEYIEKPKEEENAPVIKQVDVKKSFKGVTYAAEEEYLKILKELRNNLNLNG